MRTQRRNLSSHIHSGLLVLLFLRDAELQQQQTVPSPFARRRRRRHRHRHPTTNPSNLPSLSSQLVPHVIPRCPLTPTHSITTSISSILDPTPDSSAYFRINPEEEDCTAGETYKGGGYEQIVGQKWECRCIWRPCPEGEEEKRDSRE